ncbi:hypothetical protein [Hyphomonas sp.]|uniref:hypothetical protein n=1 Tax=Hyphomonas sp. TaxID=87 RepID=UPI002634BBD4|nr:hypothetical protein [Hyphomonas sp.]MDF1807765.1 hypothetical protein [Hyphomonas sp.]
MVNRYIPNSKLSDKQIEALLWSVCANQSVSDAARAAGVSERSAGETIRRLRRMIAATPTLFREAGLADAWPADDDPMWAALWRCVFECPSEIREPMESFGQEIMVLGGDRSLCQRCRFLGLIQPRPLLIRTLRHLKTAQRGMSLDAFKPIFLTALLYDQFRDNELDQALRDPEAMKRFGSTRHNHMTLMFEACRKTLGSPQK